MAGYTVAAVNVQDAELFGQYARQVPPLLQSFGGKYLIRGGAVEAVEGEWRSDVLIVVEWDSVETARQWYESDVYQPFRELRQQAATTKILLVQGAGSS